MTRSHRSLRALVLGGLAALMMVAFGASSAWAEPSTYCVKATKVSKIISGKTKHVFTGSFNDKGCTSANATHEGKFEKLASFTAPEEAQLKALLKYVNVQSSGVAGKPTVQFSGANVQIVNGEGLTRATNGEGNLVIGYDENTGAIRKTVGKEPGVQTGSHNLILGMEQEFTSWGGIVGGEMSSVTGGGASVIDGVGNVASGGHASVSGGTTNTASANDASVSGGWLNKASGEVSSVSGGKENTASEYEASVSGGLNNTASGVVAWVGGGFGNNAKVKQSSIFGSKLLTTLAEYEAIP